MKLNQTYPLMDLLDALNAASDNTRELAKQLKAEGRHMTAFTVYEAENMLSVSLHARVTLTRKESEDRWAGYMETSAYRDGERVPVAVNRKEYVLTANDDFSRFEIQMRGRWQEHERAVQGTPDGELLRRQAGETA